MDRPQLEPEDPVLDYTEAAHYLHVTQRHLERLVEERRIGFLRIGNRVRFRRSNLERFLDANRVESGTAVAP